jgi:hypothetical protein
MRAIGGSDLLQPRARGSHNLGHAESAADLDQLAPGDDGVASLGERIEDEKHGSGIVVGDRRILGAGELAEQCAQVIVALSAAAGFEVVFERHR